jgi:hypothetical protein
MYPQFSDIAERFGSVQGSALDDPLPWALGPPFRFSERS